MSVQFDLRPELTAIFDEQLLMDKICSSSYFKISIKRYVHSYGNKSIVFKQGLSYLNMKKIIEAFSRNAATDGFECIIAPTVSKYIADREMYLDARSKLGVEIKRQEERLHVEFDSFRETVNSLLIRQLRERQMWDAFFMLSMKKSCNFSVPGSGKTSSVFGMYSFLDHAKLIKRIVIVCPKNAFGPWIDEYHACFGEEKQLRLFSIQDETLKSKQQRKSALLYESGAANMFLFNYESIKSYQEELSSIINAETLLVFDEVHKIKRIDGEYAKAAIHIARRAGFTIAMTGTPIPNSYADIYNVLHVLYPEDYEDYFGFQVSTLKAPKQYEIDRINNKLQPFFCRTTKAQLNVPAPNSDAILPVAATSEEIKLFRILLKKYKKNKLLLMLRILQLESDPLQLLEAINLADFRYILDDDVDVDAIDYADYSNDIITLINNCGRTSKTQQCISTISGLVMQNKPVVLWCIFVNTIHALAKRLTAIGIKVKCVYGEVALSERQKLLREFKEGKYQVLISNPNTLAESISLHDICHDAMYFEYSFNLVHLLQSKDRIHRLGLAADQYTQFYFLQTMYPNENGYYSMDEEIYHRLQEKEQRMRKAIEADTLEVMPTSDEELEEIFKQVGL